MGAGAANVVQVEHPQYENLKLDPPGTGIRKLHT